MVVKIFWPSEVKGKCLWGVAICKTETTREGFDHPTVKPCTKLALMPHPLGHWVRGLGSLLYETQENEAKGPAGKVSWHERQTRTINAWTGRNLKERKLSSARGDLTYEGIVGIVVFNQGIGGLVVEYVVAIHVTRVRFPADALFFSSTRQRDMTCNMLQAIVNVKSFE